MQTPTLALAILAAAVHGSAIQAQSTPAPEAGLSAQAAPSGAAAPDQPVQVDPAAMEAMNISKVAPVYPVEAKNAAIEGDVVLYAIVDEKGRVKSLDVISGTEVLRVPALTAVKQWRYAPFIVDEVAVKVGTVITIHFRLSN